MKIERYSRESRALEMLRFPLAVLIVLLHTGYKGAETDVIGSFIHYVINNIVVLAVPTFFFMSGYLFFMGKENYTLFLYREQMKKKAKGLLLPYFLWNVISYIFSVFSNYVRTGGMGDVLPWDVVSIFWANGHGIWIQSPLGYEYPAIVSPACGVLWFIRDLMVMMICSPLIFMVVKKLRWVIFPTLLIVNLIGIGIPLVGFSLPAVTFFTIGAYFSISEMNIFDMIKGREISLVLLFLVGLVLKIMFELCNVENYGVSDTFLLWSGIPFCFTLAYKSTFKDSYITDRINRLAETGFWIYCLHGQWIIWLINKELGYVLVKLPIIGYIIEYMTMFSIRVFECILLYYLLKKYLPTLLALLTGGRVKKQV